ARSIRIELDETALVRPSNDARFLCSGSAGSTTIAETPLESNAAASASPTIPPPKMITSARSITGAYRNSSLDRRVRLRDSAVVTKRGWNMATVAVRAPKRDLAPDWREALRHAVQRFAIRTWGALLIMLSVAGAVALGSHNPTDPS